MTMSSYFSSFILLFVLSLSVSLHIVAGDNAATGAGSTATSSPNPLFHYCLNVGSYNVSDPYDKNLDIVLGSLSFKVPPTGFRLMSIGKGDQDLVNGLGLCRGDVSSLDCKTCIVEAGKEVRNRCSSEGYRGGIIWYDNCLLRHSNKFFGKIYKGYKYYLYNQNTVNDTTTLNQKTQELITDLSSKAYVTPRMFATGEMKLGESETLYGLVQCTRDLSRSECKKCLDDAISKLPGCCDGKSGGRVLGGSCNFRYELYPFVIVY